MSSLADKYYGDKNLWQTISKANPLVDPTRMPIGTKLVIPAKPSPSKPADSKPSSTSGGSNSGASGSLPAGTSNGANSHTVASGDTLISLARKYYGKDSLWETIYNANKKTIGDDPAELKVGMVLVIPAKPAS
jgi:nucleoid-associated protein YgaU